MRPILDELFISASRWRLVCRLDGWRVNPLSSRRRNKSFVFPFINLATLPLFSTSSPNDESRKSTPIVSRLASITTTLAQQHSSHWQPLRYYNKKPEGKGWRETKDLTSTPLLPAPILVAVLLHNLPFASALLIETYCSLLYSLTAAAAATAH